MIATLALGPSIFNGDPLSANRRQNVRRKLNAMALEFVGKNVLIVDGALSDPRIIWLV